MNRKLRQRLVDISGLPPKTFNDPYITGYWMCIADEPLHPKSSPEKRDGYAAAQSDIEDGLARKEPRDA